MMKVFTRLPDRPNGDRVWLRNGTTIVVVRKAVGSYQVGFHDGTGETKFVLQEGIRNEREARESAIRLMEWC